MVKRNEKSVRRIMIVLALSILIINVGMSATNTLIAPAFNASAPSLLWSYGTGGPVLDIKSIPDVTGDGKHDVIVGSADNNIYLLNGDNGSYVWSRITEGDVASVDCIADVTGDGMDDVVAGSDQPLVLHPPGRAYCLDGDSGSDFWISQPQNPMYTAQAIPDVTYDGVPDVVVGWHYWDSKYTVIHSGLSALSGTDGATAWSNERSEGSATTLYADVTTIPDVTGDGRWDVIWACQEDMIWLLNGTDGGGGKEIERVKLPADARVKNKTRLYAVPDVSGDGLSDFINLRVVHSNGSGFVYAISGPTLEAIWRRWFSGSSAENLGWFATYIQDITLDGRPEVVVSLLDSVYCLSGVTGNTVWSHTLEDSGTSITSTPDISGDGVDDIVVGVRNGSICFLSGLDGTSVLNPYEISGHVHSVAFLDDVTGDFVPEILAGGDDHFVYCLAPQAQAPNIHSVIWIPTCPPPYVSSTEPRVNEAVLVQANITDSDLSKVLLKFRIENNAWFNTTMQFNATSGLWVKIIPAQSESCTIEFFVEAWDQRANSNQSSVFSYYVQTLPIGDLNGDKIVDVYDLMLMAKHYGETSP